MSGAGASRGAEAGSTRPAPAFSQSLAVWARIGCISFGGPAGQIALMHREIVEERRWLTEDEYLNALNFCMLLPGPEAMQLATYAGWRLHGVAGGLTAGLLFVIPGAVIVLALTMLYALFGKVPPVEAAFVGIKAAVLVIVVEALLRISRRALHRALHWVLAGSAFISIFFFNLPFPLIVLAAGAIGYAATRGSATAVRMPAAARPRTLGTVAVWLCVWIVPLAALWLGLGPDHVLSRIGLFFSQLAVVTFGGAYAVLAYMGQAAVETHGWLGAGEMLDGLGLAETTPGPLILVTEFVGYLAAARRSGGHDLALGLAGALVTLWATFAPCFLWIFAGAPYVERIGRSPALKGALQGITAAVVGVILNLSLWFSLQVLIPGIEERHAGPVRYWMPGDAGYDLVPLCLALVAGLFIFVFRQGIVRTLGVCAALSLLWQLWI